MSGSSPTPSAAEGRLRNLTRKAGSNTAFVVGGNLVVNLARFVSTIVLTRLLTSADFGVVAITTTLVYVFTMITDVGFFAYVLQSPRRSEDSFLDEMWTLRLLRGIALFAAIAASSGLLAQYFGKPELQTVIVFAAAQLLFESLTSMAFVTAARDAAIRRLTLLEVLPHLVSVAASIAAAIWLRNYWAFIVGLFIGGSTKVALSYGLFRHSTRRWKFSGERLRELWSFGRHVLASSALELIIQQADKLWLGRYLPLRTFGYYSLASSLSQLPFGAMAGYSNRLLFPTFTRAHEQAPHTLSSVYYASGRPLRLLYMAGAGLLVGMAPLVVEILYDDRYAPVADYLQILAILPLLKVPMGIATDAMIASGHVRKLARLNLVRLVALLLTAIPLWQWAGAIGVPIALVCAEFCGQVYCWWVLHRIKVLQISQELLLASLAVGGFLLGSAVNEMGLLMLS